MFHTRQTFCCAFAAKSVFTVTASPRIVTPNKPSIWLHALIPRKFISNAKRITTRIVASWWYNWHRPLLLFRKELIIRRFSVSGF